MADAPSRFVIVGSGKTATDGIVWLLANGVDADRITWVRPRSVDARPGLRAAGAGGGARARRRHDGGGGEAASLDDLFLRLEAAGVMLRDRHRDVVPTMAKTPTLGTWELDLLRTIEDVVRLGHIRARAPRARSCSTRASCRSSPARSSCTAPRPACSTRRWSRSGAGPDPAADESASAFPCFGATLAGYVEATRDDDRERNRFCPPNTLPDDPANWARMQVRGTLATRAFGAEPDIAAWANACALNPARIDPSRREEPEVLAASARLAEVAGPGLARLAELSGEPLPSS